MADQDRKKRKKKKKGSALSAILFLVALGIFLFSAYKLITILMGYQKGSQEYKAAGEMFTAPNTEYGTAQSEAAVPEASGTEEAEAPAEEEEKAPITVDWASLYEVNPDIVAWIWAEAFPDIINYPVLRGKDNDEYLRHDYRHEYLYAGSIFENSENAPDFADPHTIIYGHNMLDRSMFSKLTEYGKQEVVDAHPYIWILTPRGNYKYEVFAQFETDMYSDVYTLFSGHGAEVAAWAAAQKENSVIDRKMTFSAEDYILTLSTCAKASGPTRIVVMGKCVSKKLPEADWDARALEATQETKDRINSLANQN